MFLIYLTRNLYYILLDQKFILHFTGPETYITLYWTTRNLFYILLDQNLILLSTGPETYITLYWTKVVILFYINLLWMSHIMPKQTCHLMDWLINKGIITWCFPYWPSYRSSVGCIGIRKNLILYYTWPETYITFYWTRNLYYILLDQKRILHYIGLETYITFYLTRNLYYCQIKIFCFLFDSIKL
jgi:hypothetical protein